MNPYGAAGLAEFRLRAQWRWYCRIDGQAGVWRSREERDDAALQHRDRDCITAGRPHPEWAEAPGGRLVHVWRY